MKKEYKALLIAAVISLSLTAVILATGALAAFTNSLQAQRTIAAYDGGGETFSSNLLLKGESGSNVRSVFTTSDTASTAVTVCNYRQGNKTKTNIEDIDYVFTAKFVKRVTSVVNGKEVVTYEEVDETYVTARQNEIENDADNDDYTVTITLNGSSGVTATLGASATSTNFNDREFTLTGMQVSDDTFTIAFSTAFIAHPANLYLELEAAPTSNPPSTISGILAPEFRAAGATDNWTGSFTDSTAKNPSEYDGFNYRISGTGSGSVTFTWDTSKLSLSFVSKELLEEAGATVNVGAGRVTLAVDSAQCAIYDLQFYKTASFSAQTVWNTVEDSTTLRDGDDLVTFTFS